MTELESCVKALLKNLNIKQESSKTFLNVDKGVNYTGDIKRLCVKGTKNGKKIELRLVVKMAKSHLPTRRILALDRSYQCESFMYQIVFPLFHQMQAELDNRFESYPTYFASSATYLKEILVLEDMVRYQVMNPHELLNYDRALLLVKEIGKLHAISFVLHKQDPKLFSHISSHIRDEKRNEDTFGILITTWLNESVSKILALFDVDKDQEVCKKLQNFSETVKEMFDRHYTIDCEDKYGVISHCDLWANNLLFSDGKVCIIDWQTARVCSPSLDLLEILFVCCDKKMRDKHYNDLVDAYYNSCSAHIQRFGENSNELFPYHILKEHLQKYGGYSLCISIKLIYLMSVLVDDIPEMNIVNEISDMLRIYSVVRTDPNIFDVRIRDLLLDFFSYGYDW